MFRMPADSPFLPVSNVMCRLLLFAAIFACVSGVGAGPVFAFGFDDVALRARQISTKAYERPPEPAKELQSLNYEQYNDIRYKPERFRWRGAVPFELAFFHRGFTFQAPVK